MDRCPCVSGLTYDECCGRYIGGSHNAPTAELLMRSRFSAYATSALDYLLATWHPSTRPAPFDLDPDVRWYRLDIHSRTRGVLLDTQGTVEFTAYWRTPHDRGEQHENSAFERIDGRWFYVAAV